MRKTGFIKGMGFGMMAGIAVSITAAVIYKSNKKCFKKKASRAIKTFGDLIDSVQCIMK